MRCCSRSTTWRGSVLLGGLTLLLQASAGATSGQETVPGESAVRHAVVQAVRARMGQDADVRIEDLDFKTTPAPDGALLVATPEPGARLARQNRFSLHWQLGSPSHRPPAAGGHAVARVFVVAEHLRASRDLSRGETCAEADVALTRGEVGAVLLQRLPGARDAVGSRVLRPIAADDVITSTAVQFRPTVLSGDVVTVRARVDGAMVQGQAVAQQSGVEGDIIRVVNKESRRSLRARILGPGQVEVVQ
jgi:flagella basal body P-ring formation protein FlgA